MMYSVVYYVVYYDVLCYVLCDYSAARPVYRLYHIDGWAMF